MNKAIKDKAIEFRRINLNYIPLVVLIVLVSCTGILPDIFITVGSLICVMMLAFTPCLYLAVPVMVFYHSQLGIIAGISAFRLFTFLFFAVMLYQQKDKISLKKTIPLCIIVLYDLLVLSQYNVRMAVFNIFDHICIWMIVVFVFNTFKIGFINPIFSVLGLDYHRDVARLGNTAEERAGCKTAQKQRQHRYKRDQFFHFLSFLSVNLPHF